jgi:hypothetical protein
LAEARFKEVLANIGAPFIDYLFFIYLIILVRRLGANEMVPGLKFQAFGRPWSKLFSSLLLKFKCSSFDNSKSIFALGSYAVLY